jgi:putative nucleotidyltransferase with HDIG domain
VTAAPASLRWAAGGPSTLATSASPPSTEPAADQESALWARLEGGMLALPILPEVAAAARRLAAQCEASPSSIHALVASDVVLVARLVAAASEARAADGIRSAAEAIDRLGVPAAREVLFRIAHAVVRTPRRFGREIEASVRRASRCAAAAEAIARRLALPVDEARLVGLLHDVGELRVWRAAAEADFVTSADEARRLVRHLHERAGADLARAWRLPVVVEEACAAHHGVAIDRTPAQRLAAASSAVVDAAVRGLSPARLEVLAAVGIDLAQARELVARLAPGRQRSD